MFKNNEEIDQFVRSEEYGSYKDNERQRICFAVNVDKENYEVNQIEYHLRFNISNYQEPDHMFTYGRRVKYPFKTNEIWYYQNTISKGLLSLQTLIDSFIIAKTSENT